MPNKALLDRPSYEALNGEGYAYWREAHRIHELPVSARGEALENALPALSEVVAMPATKELSFGLPVFAAFGMMHRVAARHEHAKLLMTQACDLPLDYVAMYAPASD